MDILQVITYLEDRLKIVQKMHDAAKNTHNDDACNIYFGQEILINEMLGIFRLMEPTINVTSSFEKRR